MTPFKDSSLSRRQPSRGDAILRRESDAVLAAFCSGADAGGARSFAPKPKVASEVDAPVTLSLIFMNAEERAMDELRP